MDKYNKILDSLTNKKEVKEELLKYCQNKFNVLDYDPKKEAKEEFIFNWMKIIDKIKEVGIEKALNDSMPHGEEDIKFEDPDSVRVEIYDSIAGDIPIIYAKNENDFYEIVTKVIYKGKRPNNLEKTGASFAFSHTNRFIILSNKPYSNIDSDKIGLTDEQWRKMSMIIRREHESTHYFTKKFLGSSQNNLHDELVADFIGIYCAAGEYHARWFLLGLGIDKDDPEEKSEGRFLVYTKDLSEEAKIAMRKIIINAAYNVQKWAKEEGKGLSRNDLVLFLCGNSLLDLFLLY